MALCGMGILPMGVCTHTLRTVCGPSKKSRKRRRLTWFAKAARSAIRRYASCLFGRSTIRVREYTHHGLGSPCHIKASRFCTIQTVLGDVPLDTCGHQIAERFPVPYALAYFGGTNLHQRNLDDVLP
jgi:hypothetical protein